jgi:Flp pilus assembly protein TadD
MRDLLRQRPASEYDPTGVDRFDEDERPMAAAALAAVTDPVPVHPADGHRLGHAGQLLWRAGGLMAVVILAHLPLLINATLPDGEDDALRLAPVAVPVGADFWRLPASLIKYPTGVPRLMGWLIRVELARANSAWSHHALAVVLQSAAAVLLWLLLRRLGRPGAWLAAAAFAAWPGGTAALAWVAQRGRPCGAVLALLGVLLLLRAAGIPPKPEGSHEEDEEDLPTGWRRAVAAIAGPVRDAVAILALLAAALCQPGLAGAGVIAAILILWVRGRFRKLDWLVLTPALLIAVAAGVGLARPHATPPETLFGHDPVAALSLPLRWLWQTGRAVERIAWPTVSADLATPGSPREVELTSLVGVVFWGALVAAVAVRRWAGSGPAVALAVAALLLPTAAVPPALALPVDSRMPGNPAATYLIVIPLLVVLADAVVVAARWIKADLPQRLAEIAAATVAVAALGAAAAVRSTTYRDTEGVLRTLVAVEGQSWSSRSLLAGYYVRNKQLDAAQAAMVGLTLGRCPDAVTAITYGRLLQADGDVAGALPWYDLAGQLDPSDVQGVIDKAAALLQLRGFGDASLCFRAGVEAHPDSAELHAAFGNLLLQASDSQNAADQFRRALLIDPDSSAFHVDLAASLIRLNDVAAAAAELQRAVDLDPDNYDAYHAAGVVLFQMREYPRAIRMFQEAIRRRPDLPGARNDLGVALTQAGRYKAAIFEFEEALRLDPTNPMAKQNIEVARRRDAAQKQRALVEGK